MAEAGDFLGNSESETVDSDGYDSREPVSVAGSSSESTALVSTPPSILDRLRSPTPSDLARKRKIRQNLPPKGVKRGKGRGFADPKGVVPADRVRNYPEESFTVSNNRLFCSACREEVATKQSVIELHIKSQKHSRGKSMLFLYQAQQTFANYCRLFCMRKPTAYGRKLLGSMCQSYLMALYTCM